MSSLHAGRSGEALTGHCSCCRRLLLGPSDAPDTPTTDRIARESWFTMMHSATVRRRRRASHHACVIRVRVGSAIARRVGGIDPTSGSIATRACGGRELSRRSPAIPARPARCNHPHALHRVGDSNGLTTTGYALTPCRWKASPQGQLAPTDSFGRRVGHNGAWTADAAASRVPAPT